MHLNYTELLRSDGGVIKYRNKEIQSLTPLVNLTISENHFEIVQVMVDYDVVTVAWLNTIEKAMTNFVKSNPLKFTSCSFTARESKPLLKCLLKLGVSYAIKREDFARKNRYTSELLAHLFQSLKDSGVRWTTFNTVK